MQVEIDKRQWRNIFNSWIYLSRKFINDMFQWV